MVGLEMICNVGVSLSISESIYEGRERFNKKSRESAVVQSVPASSVVEYGHSR